MFTASDTTDTTARASAQPQDNSGWVVRDPADRPYAWCGSTLAHDADTAMAIVEPDAARREHMLRCGWSIRAAREINAPTRLDFVKVAR